MSYKDLIIGAVTIMSESEAQNLWSIIQTSFSSENVNNSDPVPLNPVSSHNPKSSTMHSLTPKDIQDAKNLVQILEKLPDKEKATVFGYVRAMSDMNLLK